MKKSDLQDDATSKSQSLAPQVASIEELHSHHEWFFDPARSEAENEGPFVVVCDDFYAEPHEVRKRALGMKWVTYSPPSSDQVGAEVAGRFAGKPGLWETTSLVQFWGVPVLKPFLGERYNPPELKRRIEALLKEQIDEASWKDGLWNGVFQRIDEGWNVDRGAIHHHYKEGDTAPRGWNGVVFLSPDAPPSAGTTIWREKSSGRCVASFGAKFEDKANFEVALSVENKFNRLVLFRESVLHRAEHGFGNGATSRLTQTFFFRTAKL